MSTHLNAKLETHTDLTDAMTAVTAMLMANRTSYVWCVMSPSRSKETASEDALL